MNGFFCMNIIDCNVKKFGYNEHLMIMSSFFCIFILVVSGAQCMLLLGPHSNGTRWKWDSVEWKKTPQTLAYLRGGACSLRIKFFTILWVYFATLREILVPHPVAHWTRSTLRLSIVDLLHLILCTFYNVFTISYSKLSQLHFILGMMQRRIEINRAFRK